MKLQSAYAQLLSWGCAYWWLASMQRPPPEAHQPQPACDEHCAQLGPWVAQYEPQLPGQVASAAGQLAGPSACSSSHVPVAAQNPQPICELHASQVVNAEHASPTISVIGRMC